ncbi:MAG: hypothetical protein QOE92_1965 [Chloroflexota bacterium]|jgi:hypothetical protein|nr:hypothetical protein [Chloroflexota bacterium]
MNTRILKASAKLARPALILGTLAVFGPLPPAAALAACDPATHAVQYLAAHQSDDGSVDASVGETSDFVLSAAADGVDPNTLTGAAGKTPYDYLAADLAAPTPKAFKDANQLGKVVQAVVAGRHEATAFGGRDLLAKLTSTSGSPAFYDAGTGAFYDQFGGDNQAFANAQAILALAAAGDAGHPVPPAAVTELKSLQGTTGTGTGGWSAFGFYDTNTTAMALMALAAAGDTPANDTGTYAAAYAFLHTQQDPATGGFPLTTDFGPDSDPDSDALVIQALTAAGENAGGAAWSNTAGNATTDILAFQDPASGGFAFSRGGKLQTFATTQVAGGLRRAPFPVPATYTSGAALPADGCPVAAAAEAPAGPGLPAAGAGPAQPPLSPPAGALVVALAAASGVAALALRPPGPRRRAH